MNLGLIISISLIGVGVLACILALIWTKLIKPNAYGYTSKAWWVDKQLREQAKKLIDQQKLHRVVNDAAFKAADGKYGFIDHIYFGNDHVYLVGAPLYWNIVDVKFDHQNILMVNKKAKTFELPLDTQVFYKSVKAFKKYYGHHDNIKVIIPCLNKSFTTKTINDFIFMQIDDVTKFITTNENSAQCQYVEFEILLKDQIVVQKPKRGILPTWMFRKKDSSTSFK